MKKQLFILSALPIFALLFCSGCASSRPVPRSYFQQPCQLSVEVVRIPPKPAMRDSGQGGLIGALVTSTSRASNMREKMAGIQGETVKELLRQEMVGQMQDSFQIVESSKDLKLEVNVNSYGFFVPTTVAGIKTGGYQMEILGGVEVRDIKSKKKVAFTPVTAQAPLGSKPTADAVPEAVGQTIKTFATSTRNVLLKQKP
jgi:hypothetical protein